MTEAIAEQLALLASPDDATGILAGHTFGRYLDRLHARDPAAVEDALDRFANGADPELAAIAASFLDEVRGSAPPAR